MNMFLRYLDKDQWFEFANYVPYHTRFAKPIPGVYQPATCLVQYHCIPSQPRGTKTREKERDGRGGEGGGERGSCHHLHGWLGSSGGEKPKSQATRVLTLRRITSKR